MAELQVFIAWLLVHRSKHCSFVNGRASKLLLSFLWSVSAKSTRMKCTQAVRHKRFTEEESGWYRWRTLQGYGSDYLDDLVGSEWVEHLDYLRRSVNQQPSNAVYTLNKEYSTYDEIKNIFIKTNIKVMPEIGLIIYLALWNT